MDINTLKSENIHKETSVLGQDVRIPGIISDDEDTEEDTLDKVSIEHGEPGKILFYL